jgi:hypothetical protein
MTSATSPPDIGADVDRCPDVAPMSPMSPISRMSRCFAFDRFYL